MSVDPITPTLKPKGTKRLRPRCDILLVTSAFKFNLRRYSEDCVMRMPLQAVPRQYKTHMTAANRCRMMRLCPTVGRCRLAG